MKEKRLIKRIFALAVSLFFVASCKAEYGWLNLTEKSSSSSAIVPEIITHTCTFTNYDNKVLEIDKVLDGGTVRYLGDNPKKPDDFRYSFSFSGWDKSLSNITKDTTFIAQYSSSVIYYTVNYWNDSEKKLRLATQQVACGDYAVYNGVLTPWKETENNSFYHFSGWQSSSASTVIIGDTDYTPIFDKYTFNPGLFTFTEKVVDGVPVSYLASNYSGVGKNVIFPDHHAQTTYGDLPVANVGQMNDVAKPVAEKIILPESVTTIESHAFEECAKINDVIFPYSLTTIGSYAFGDDISLYELKLPENLTNIEENAFSGSNISVLTFVEGAKYPDATKYAFANMKNLINFFPQNDLSIFDAYCFQNDYKLSAIVLPKGTYSIKANAFLDCHGDDPSDPTDVPPSDNLKIYYGGTKEDKDRLLGGTDPNYNFEATGNDVLTNGDWYFYSKNPPAETTNKYWYYDSNGNPTSWN